MTTPSQPMLFDLVPRYGGLSHHGDPLESLAAPVPWLAGRPWNECPPLQAQARRPAPFGAVLMFKILVPQAAYNLTNDHTEYQVRDRLSFLRFLGLDLDQNIPNTKTSWFFPETLLHVQVVESLFAQCEAYLPEQSLQPRGGQLIDASLVPAPKQRNSRDANATIKAGSVRRGGRVSPPNDDRMTRKPVGP